MPGHKLSELEGCVLALIWSGGAVTPYALRQEFLKSPSPQWSGSAGAIYPLVERLERRAVIRSTAHATGKREGKRYSLTSGGVSALKKWLLAASDDFVVGVPPDPLRTRLYFLGALPARKRDSILASARQGVERQLQTVLEDYRKKPKDSFDYWVTYGALLVMRARKKWLQLMSEAVRAGKVE